MTLRKTLSNYACSTDDSRLNDFISEEDLYYSIYPLHSLIREKFNSKVLKFITPSRFENTVYITESLIAQINLQIRNNFLQYILVHELNVADVAGLLEEHQVSSKLLQFIKLTAEAEWVDYLFSKYKYLDERLQIYLDNVFKNTERLLNRTAQDFQLIADFLNNNGEKIKEVSLFLGDLHQNGQAVAKIRYESKNVLYKPRVQLLEMELNALLEFLNKIGADVNILIPEFINRDEYSWTRFIENEAVSGIDAIGKFYKNQGKAMALFHILGSVDLMHDNVIANGEIPAFIDLECVLSKPLPIDRSSLFLNFFETSVVATGILPILGIGDNLVRDYFSGALHSRATDKVDTRVWENQKSSEIKLVTKAVYRTNSEQEKHLPIFEDKKLEINDQYLLYVKAGFQSVYNFILRYKMAIINFIVEQGLFSKSVFRIIPHPTAVYEKLGKSLLTPEAFERLGNERELRRIMNNTFSFKTKSINRHLSNSIIQQLKNGDIPYFYAKSNSRHLYTCDHQIAVPNYFQQKTNCAQDIIKRIKKASSKNLGIQQEIVSGSINFFLHLKRDHFMITDSMQYLHLDVKKDTKSDLLNGAITVADYLIEKSIDINHEVNWLIKTTNTKDQQYEFSPMTYDLYEGLAGIAFFLLYAFKYTQKPEYMQTAERIFNNGKSIFIKQRRIYKKRLTDIEKKAVPLSPFYYPSSLVFLMEHFIAFDKSYLDNEFLEEYFNYLEEIVLENDNCDILGGLAGLLELLLTIKDIVSEERVHSLIKKVTEQILKNAAELGKDKVAWEYFSGNYEEKKFFGGYAHGTSGIALTLIRASKELQREDLLRKASAAINYDRSLFSEERRFWVDLRDDTHVWDSMSWCHGSSGIGMSRALMSDFIQDPFLREEISIAVENTLKTKTQSACLCHGKGSDLEILKICNTQLKDRRLETLINNGVNELTGRVLSDSFQMVYGDGSKMEMLGLFLGLSGIGYLFLRFYDWENMPSVLSLESSKLNYKAAH